MNKRLLRSFLAVLMGLMITVSVLGAMSARAALSYVVDETGSLTQEQIKELDARLAEQSASNQCDIVFVMVNSLNGVPVETAADTYYDNNVGYGAANSGIVLYISLGDGEYAFSTGGYAYSVFSDYECNEIASQVVPYLQSSDYYSAVKTFGDGADYYLQHAGQDQTGAVVEKKHNPIWAPIAALVGAIAGWIGTGGQKAALKSVHQQQGAQNYVRQGSFQVTDAREQYLYSQVTRTRRQTEQPNRPTNSRPSGGGGGGVHGGTSGKF